MIGNGNVALDVARILAKTREEFAGSDNEELFLEEREAAQAKLLEEQRQRAAAIPGMIPQSEQPADFTMDT